MEKLDDASEARSSEQTGWSHQLCRACSHEAFGNKNLGHRCPAASASAQSVSGAPLHIPVSPDSLATHHIANRSRRVSVSGTIAHTYSNRQQEANFASMTSTNSVKTPLYYPFDVLAFAVVGLPSSWAAKDAFDILAGKPALLSHLPSHLSTLFDPDRLDSSAAANLRANLGKVVWQTAPAATRSADLVESWLEHQAVDRAFVYLASIAPSRPVLPAGFEDAALWADTNRLHGVFEAARLAGARRRSAGVSL